MNLLSRAIYNHPDVVAERERQRGRDGLRKAVEEAVEDLKGLSATLPPEEALRAVQLAVIGFMHGLYEAADGGAIEIPGTDGKMIFTGGFKALCEALDNYDAEHT